MNLRNAAIMLSFLLTALATTTSATTPASVSASALPSTTAARLERLARQFLAEQLPGLGEGSSREISITPPDPRLQLTACPAPQAFWPGNARATGTTVVGIRCPTGTGWQVFLPVQIEEWSQVVVASRPLRPREVLQASDLRLLKVNRSQLRGNTFSKPDALIGALTRQAIATGQPLTEQLTCRICRGDTVSIAAGSAGFEVIMKGVAEGYGNIGDRIPVRNTSSRRLVQATVVADGKVAVML